MSGYCHVRGLANKEELEKMEMPFCKKMLASAAESVLAPGVWENWDCTEVRITWFSVELSHFMPPRRNHLHFASLSLLMGLIFSDLCVSIFSAMHDRCPFNNLAELEASSWLGCTWQSSKSRFNTQYSSSVSNKVRTLICWVPEGPIWITVLYRITYSGGSGAPLDPIICYNPYFFGPYARSKEN